MAHREANGAAIRMARELLGEAHGKFATKVGISPGYLSNIEAGKKQPSPEVLGRIRDALGVPHNAITSPVRDLAGAA